ncbi:MAG: cellulase family glycosylhydrolase [Acidimicrobiales bacterium]
MAQRRLLHLQGKRRTAMVVIGVLVLAALLVPLLVSGDNEPPGAFSVPVRGFVSGVISAPGGAFLRDRFGRVVVLHGVNAVYKRAPFELYPAPGKPFNFSGQDANRIAALGFNVVRLGMLWQGLEPGTAGPNDPAICRPGPPGDPGQFDQTVLDSYLSKLKRTVDLLGRRHIYTLLDMHQDVYSELFGGEGAPAWAVCTDGLPAGPMPGRWSRTYASPALRVAFGHFWRNDVVGNLQGEYDRVWAAVASFFRSDPWVIGYDPINEPFSTVTQDVQQHDLDAQIECLYTGSARPGRNEDQDLLVSCPRDDPKIGLIPTILSADPRHLVFYEPDIFSSRDGPNYVGPMDLPNLVLNFHTYCPNRNGVTGDPTDLTACISHEAATLSRRAGERVLLGSNRQPAGPAWLMGEFGATSNPSLVAAVTATANQHLVGWVYWQWKFYGDPTGSSHEALVGGSGKLRPTALALSQVFAEAVAGSPTSMSFDSSTGAFDLSYTPDPAVRAATLVVVPKTGHYLHGYCAAVSGGAIVSKAGSRTLEVANEDTSHVDVRVTPGSC